MIPEHVPCRHLHVQWLDADRARCHDCGKLGYWSSDGWVLWRRYTDDFSRSTAAVLRRRTSTTSMPVPKSPQPARRSAG